MSDAPIILKWKPFPWQAEALRRLKNRTVIVVARQTGKTVMLEHVLLDYCLGAPGHYGFVTPTKARSGEVFEELYTRLPESIAHPEKTKRKLKFFNGAVAHFVSVEQDRGLRGATWNGAMFDECQEMEGSVVDSTFMPFLSATGGWAIFCGTPPDTSTAPDPYFFEDLFEQAKVDPRMCLIHHDHTIRSKFDATYRVFVEEFKRGKPKAIFDREYMANFDSPEQRAFDVSRINWYEGFHKMSWTKTEGQVVINIDPSFKDSETADPRAIVASALSPDGDLYVLTVKSGRWPYSIFLDKIFDTYDVLQRAGFPMRSSWVDLETNGPGLPFFHAIQERIERTRHPMRVRPRTSIQSKYNRILSLEPWMRDGRIWLRASTNVASRRGFTDMEEQFRQFPRGLIFGNAPKGHHYDIIDAFAQRTLDFSPPRKFVREAHVMPSGKLMVKFEFDEALKPGGLSNPGQWSFDHG